MRVVVFFFLPQKRRLMQVECVADFCLVSGQTEPKVLACCLQVEHH